MARGPHRLARAGALAALLGSALLAGCGGSDEPALRPQGQQPAGKPPAASTPAAASTAAVFRAEKVWADPKGNRFTILATVHRPSNAGLEMCSMSTEFLGPSMVLSVRNDSRTSTLTGPRLIVNDRAVAFPHGKYACSYSFAPSYQERFKPGESHTYRAMVMPVGARFTDVVLGVNVPAKKKGTFTTKELFRIPAAKLYEAYRQGPVPTSTSGPQPSHHG